MKRFQILMTATLLAALVIGFTAFTNKSYHKKAFATRCFIFTDPTSNGIDPTDAEVTTSANYAETSPQGTAPSCGLTRQVLCGICFDDAQFPLTSGGLPDFSTYPVLAQLVKDHKTDVTNHGVQVFAPAPDQTKWIKPYFKAR